MAQAVDGATAAPAAWPRAAKKLPNAAANTPPKAISTPMAAPPPEGEALTCDRERAATPARPMRVAIQARPDAFCPRAKRNSTRFTKGVAAKITAMAPEAIFSSAR